MSNPAAAVAEGQQSEETVAAVINTSPASSSSPILCVFCSVSFPSYSSLQDHFELSHNVMDPESNNSSIAPNIKCFLCPTEFDTFETAGKHYVFSHKLFHIVKKKQGKENVAEKTGKSSHNMGNSTEKAKEQQQVSNSDSKKQLISPPPPRRVMYKCISCDFMASNMNDVRAHVNCVHPTAAQQHSNSKNPSGDVESSTIPTPSDDGSNSGNNIKPMVVRYKCKVCSFTSSNEEDVRVHLKANHSVKSSSLGKRPLMPKLSSPNVNKQPVASTSFNSDGPTSTNIQYKCGLCTLMFLTVEDARVHWITSHQEQTPKAPNANCSGQSPKKQDKKKQNLRVTKSTNCQLCKFTCTSTTDMNEHLVDMHMFLSCAKCHSLCPDAKALVDHTVMVHKDKQASAEKEMEQDMDMDDVAATTTAAKTTAATADPSNITKSHRSSSTENKTTTQQLCCMHCGIRFYSQQGLQIHAKIAHNSTPAKRKKVKPEVENDKDTLPPKTKKTKIKLKVKKSKKPKAITIRGEAKKCGICKVTLVNLKDHFLKKHKKEVGNRKLRQNQCLLCKEIYPSINHLKNHLAQEHDGKTLREIKIQQHGSSMKTRSCLFCSELFVNRKSMFDHCRINHPGEEVERCKICNKGFNHPYRLQGHMEIHQPDYKPHQCPQCPAILATRIRLSKHRRAHHTEEGQRLKSCDLCDKTFRWPMALSRHRAVVHATVAAFHCDQCPKAFRSKRYLEWHMAALHNSAKTKAQKKRKTQQQLDKGHLCFLCGYKCSSSTTLKAHMKRHEEGEMKGFPRKQPAPRGSGTARNATKPLACGVGECKKRFRKEFWRARHWKLDHGVGDWVRKKERHGGADAVTMKDEEESEEESEEEESD